MKKASREGRICKVVRVKKIIVLSYEVDRFFGQQTAFLLWTHMITRDFGPQYDFNPEYIIKEVLKCSVEDWEKALEFLEGEGLLVRTDTPPCGRHYRWFDFDNIIGRKNGRS